MKTLTLTQPWASLVARGAKKVETRSWRTSYRGPLAIHAARRFPIWARCYAMAEPCRPAFQGFPEAMAEAAGFPLGVVIATCTLTDCVPTEKFDKIGGGLLSEQEREFGDYAPGRFAWLLEDIKLLPEPIPARGALSLWNWEPTI